MKKIEILKSKIRGYAYSDLEFKNFIDFLIEEAKWRGCSAKNEKDKIIISGRDYDVEKVTECFFWEVKKDV